MTGRRVFVESTSLETVMFSAHHNVLELEFRNGLVYEYFGVPLALYQQLIAAPSKGALVNRFVRGRFPHRRANRRRKMTQ